MSVGLSRSYIWLGCLKGGRFIYTSNLSITQANMFSMDFAEALPQSCYRATSTDWESLYNKRPNSIYEEVEMKVRLSASDIPQIEEIEISDSDSIANSFNENTETVILYAPQLKFALSVALTTFISAS